MSAFFTGLGQYRGTFGATLNSQVQADVFYARARKYNSAVEASLDGANIPPSVYTRLVEGVNKHLPTFHRYLGLRKRMMKVPRCLLHLYAPLAHQSIDDSVEKHRSIHDGTEAAREDYLRWHARVHRRGSICIQTRATRRRLLERRRPM